MVGFIGVGNMAGAILSGVLKSGKLSEENVGLYDAFSAPVYIPLLVRWSRGRESSFSL